MFFDYKKLNKQFVEYMEEELESNPFNYIDSDDGTLDFDKLEQQSLQRLTSYLEEDMSSSEIKIFRKNRVNFQEEVLAKTPNKVYRSLEIEAREIYRDSDYYRKDPMGYHGLNQSDFL